MSSTATTPTNDRGEWREALRAAAAEIATEEVRDFLAQDDAGVTFDRRYLARRRKALRQVNRPHKTHHRAPWAIAAVLALALLPTWVLMSRQTPQPSVGEESVKPPASASTVEPADTDKTVDRMRTEFFAGLVDDYEWKAVNILQNGVSARIDYTVPAETVWIRDIISDRNYVKVPGVSDGQTYSDVRAILYGDTAFPRAVGVTFGEGIQILSVGYSMEETSEVSDRFPRLEVLQLPASLENIYCSTELMEGLVLQDLTTIEPKWGEAGFNFWRTVKEETGYSHLYYTFPPDLSNLRVILVAEGNERFWDERGMLYGNSFVRLDVEESEYPQSQLLCLPQNYSYTTQVDGQTQVTLPEGTDYIHTGAVYHCNIDRLVIPASVTRIAPAAIAATYARPLTVVGQKGSAAEEYVRMFGDKYFLKFEAIG